ncbi:MAG: PD40 domain-containing protein [Anaerolineae bacterium]|nr:PD40 domain-containing protein [Anaerolineae bacterium]
MVGRLSYKVLLALVLIALAACNPATPTPNLTPLALQASQEPPAAATETPTPTDTPTVTFTPTASDTPTPTATWTPWVVIGTYTISPTFTPSLTFTPSMTFTPSLTYTPSDTPTATLTPRPPTFTPTEDQPAPVILAVAPASSALMTAEDPRCAPDRTRVTAQVESTVGLYSIELNYVLNGVGGQVVPMVNDAPNLYGADLGPFQTAGVVAFWVTAADNWGKWVSSEPQQITVSDCDVEALNATEAAATAIAITATANATYGGPTATPGGALIASDVGLQTTVNTPTLIGFSAQGGFPPYTFTINTQPLHGTITGQPPLITYTPNNNYAGTDSFTFLAEDSAGQRDVGVVTITITAGDLTAHDQNLNFGYNSSNNPLTLNVTGGVPPYTVSVTALPGHGTLAPDGSDPLDYTYTPDGGFSGTDSFTYTVYDNAGTSDSATVTITIQPPAPSGQIVFASNRDGDYDLYLVNSDGTGLVQVFDTPNDEIEPAWSPDGSQIVFASDADGDFDLYTINADGTGLTGPLTVNTASDRMPAWSPSGQYWAYASDASGEWDIMRMATADQSTLNLGTPGMDDRNPTWSPDSTRIAYQSGTGSEIDIYVMHPDGSNKTQLTSAAGRDIEPAWSPNGLRIAFASNRSSNFELYTMSTGGADVIAVTDRTAADRAPGWSPDSSYLVLYNDSSGDNEIRLIGASGGSGGRLTNDGADDIDPAWQP